jgi:hypothetical protein
MNNFRNDKIPSGYRAGQLQQFTPQQLKLFKQMFSRISPDSDLSKMAQGDEEYFDEMEAPELRRFNEIQGGLASRFSNMGMGARNSSGFQNTSTAAASNFSQDLASRRQALQRQARMDLMDMSNTLLNQKPYERILTEKRQKEPGFWKQFGSNFAQSAGKSLGSGLFGGGGGSGGGQQAFQAGGVSSAGNLPMMI